MNTNFFIKTRCFPYRFWPLPTRIVGVFFFDFVENSEADPLTVQLLMRRKIRMTYKEFRHPRHENLAVIFAKIEGSRFDEAAILINNTPSKVKVLYGDSMYEKFDAQIGDIRESIVEGLNNGEI